MCACWMRPPKWWSPSPSTPSPQPSPGAPPAQPCLPCASPSLIRSSFPRQSPLPHPHLPQSPDLSRHLPSLNSCIEELYSKDKREQRLTGSSSWLGTHANCHPWLQLQLLSSLLPQLWGLHRQLWGLHQQLWDLHWQLWGLPQQL